MICRMNFRSDKTFVVIIVCCSKTDLLENSTILSNSPLMTKPAKVKTTLCAVPAADEGSHIGQDSPR